MYAGRLQREFGLCLSLIVIRLLIFVLIQPFSWYLNLLQLICSTAAK